MCIFGPGKTAIPSLYTHIKSPNSPTEAGRKVPPSLPETDLDILHLADNGDIKLHGVRERPLRRWRHVTQPLLGAVLLLPTPHRVLVPRRPTRVRLLLLLLRWWKRCCYRNINYRDTHVQEQASLPADLQLVV